MHICFITIDYHHQKAGGGIASYIDTLGRALVSRGHQVTVLAPGASLQKQTVDKLTVATVPLGNLHWYFYRLRAPSPAVLPIREMEWSLALQRGLAWLLNDSTPIDVVEGSETGMVFIARRLANRLPVIMRLHGAPYTFRKYSRQPISLGERLNHRLELATLRRASAVTAPSRFQAQEIGRDLGWSPDTIKAIPNPIAPNLVQAALQAQPANGHSQLPPTVLYTGRIEYPKGTLSLLASIPRVARACPEVQYLIAGGRHTSIDDRTLNQALDRENIRAHVQLLGHIPWSQLVETYRQAAVFVMPSYYETFGISVIEAMAFGLPVVATTAGGLPEVVEDGLTGILVPPGDSQSLAEAVIQLLRDPDLRRRMGEAGRERVSAKFIVDKVVGQTLAVYEGVIQNH